jgi:hypothetical protein
MTTKYYIGLLVSAKQLEVFGDDRPCDTVLAESGYDFISGPYVTLYNAQENLNSFAAAIWPEVWAK